MDLSEYDDGWGYGPFSEVGVKEEDVESVIHYRAGENDSDSWLIVAKLTDGRFAYINAWCDYTGWDCQAGGEITYADSLDDLIPEMDTEGRTAFGYEPTPDCGV